LAVAGSPLATAFFVPAPRLLKELERRHSTRIDRHGPEDP